MDFSSLLPETISIYAAVFLIILNLICSFISTALSLGGGILMLVGLSFVVPPLALIPVHGIIQLGSNFARIFVSVKDLDKSVLKVFDVKNSMNAKKSHGGTSVINVKSMIKKYKREI